MVATVWPARFGTEFARMGAVGPDGIVASSSWVTVERFRSSPPDTGGDWYIGAGFSAIVPPTVTGWLRVRATDANGATWITEESVIAGVPEVGQVTKFPKVLDGAETPGPYLIEVQCRTSGQGFMRVTEVEPMWVSSPPPSLEQPSMQAGFVGGAQQQNGFYGPATFNNTIPGTGNTFIAMTVAPGPGDDVGGESWVDPHPDAELVIDYVASDIVTFPYVQRFRVWSWTEDGAGAYSFGFNASGPQSYQQSALFALDRRVPFVRGFGAVAGTFATLGYPSVDVVDDYLVMAISTTQQNDELLNGPAGYTPLFNGTTTPGGGAATDWRRMAQHYRYVSNATETPSGELWSAGTGEAHAHFVLTIPPGS